MAKESKWVKQAKKPKFKTQFHSRCRMCGRPKGYIRYFALCRLCFRKLALNQELPGVTKASW